MLLITKGVAVDVTQAMEKDHVAVDDVIEIVDQELDILEGLSKPAKVFDEGVVATLNYEDNLLIADELEVHEVKMGTRIKQEDELHGPIE